MIDEYLDKAQRLRDAGDHQGAQAACQQAHDADNTDFRPHYMLGMIAIDQAMHRDALEHFAEAVRLDPDNRDALLNYGMSLKDFGDFDKAEECFRHIIELHPAYSPGYYNLVSVRSIKANDPLIGQIETLAKSEFENDHEKSLAYFSLGKIYDDLGEYDDAFKNYAKANQLQGKVYDHQNTEMMFGRAKEVFTRDFMDRHKGSGNPSRTPVFILGMPRSGSSLVEELLCRNENVTGYSERAEIAEIVLRLERAHPSHRPYPEIVHEITGEQYSKLGDLYLMLLSQINEPSERTVDKNVLNHSVAGFIRLLFPQAAIIHTVRDPIDTCLSCYFQNFRKGIEYSFDLTDLGNRYAAYAGLMQHWREVMGSGLFEVNYEQLTQDKDQELARIFDHIDMPVPETTETPVDRAIPTASAWQARQPIYSSSVHRWKNYEKHLGPLFSALEEAGFNYDEK